MGCDMIDINLVHNFKSISQGIKKANPIPFTKSQNSIRGAFGHFSPPPSLDKFFFKRFAYKYDLFLQIRAYLYLAGFESNILLCLIN